MSLYIADQQKLQSQAAMHMWSRSTLGADQQACGESAACTGVTYVTQGHESERTGYSIDIALACAAVQPIVSPAYSHVHRLVGLTASARARVLAASSQAANKSFPS